MKAMIRRALAGFGLAPAGQLHRLANESRQASDKAAAALTASQQQLAAKQDLGQSLTTAATASQEAAKKLPEDKELAAAAEKFAAKATAVAAEVAAATKAVNDLMPPAKAAADALVAAKQKVTETAAKYAPLKQAVESAKEQWYAAAEKARLDNAALMARRIYATGLDDFERVYAREAREVRRTVERVIAIYARENGQGMAFPAPAPGAATAPAAGNASTMAVVSPATGDGRTHVCANLAILFAQLGEPTLIVDADLRGGCMHRLFGIDNAVGLSSHLSRRTTAAPIRAVPGIDHLHLLPCGPLPPNPQELLSRAQFALLLEELAHVYAYILIDTPAAARHGESATVAVRASGCLMVVRRNRTRIAEAQVLADGLGKLSAQVIGAVVNEH